MMPRVKVAFRFGVRPPTNIAMVYYNLSHFSPLGWHTYSTALIAHGENVKVVQELMRHASSRFTLEVYTQAKVKAKRELNEGLWR